MKKTEKLENKVTLSTIFGNFLLFILKISTGILFNSISLISDALNSFLDVITSIIIRISIRVSHQRADKNHQFGHTRSQPIAALAVAIVTSVFGFQVFMASLNRLISKEQIVLGALPLFIMVIVMLTKAGFLFYSWMIYKKTKSVALKAAMVDHKNDILIAVIVLFGLYLSNKGLPIFDALAGILISFYIIASGYNLGKENLRLVMGEAPSEDIFNKIEKITLSVEGVIDINDIRAQMLGTGIETEVHIYVDPKIHVKHAHDIGKKVKRKLESHIAYKAFIHIDPYYGEKISRRKFK